MYNKIIKDVKVPLRMEGGDRIDDTPVHKALREALANCLVNADYYGTCGVVIRKESDKLSLENPGYIRTGKTQMRLGGMSDPRNKALMKMFNLINIGERAGSGVPNIFQVWEAQGWTEPVIIERFNPDRTILELYFAKKVPEKKCRKKVPEKIAEKKYQKKITRKTQEHYEIILSAMQPEIWYKVSDFADMLTVGERRIKLLLSDLVELGRLESTGSTKGKKYRLKEK